MSEMIERVARAISDDLESTFPERVRQSWDQLSGPARASHRRRARAAIEAMRECDDKMLRAFWDRSASPDFYPDDSSGSEWYGDADDFKKGWAAAIDEALK